VTLCALYLLTCRMRCTPPLTVEILLKDGVDYPWHVISMLQKVHKANFQLRSTELWEASSLGFLNRVHQRDAATTEKHSAVCGRTETWEAAWAVPDVQVLTSGHSEGSPQSRPSLQNPPCLYGQVLLIPYAVFHR